MKKLHFTFWFMLFLTLSITACKDDDDVDDMDVHTCDAFHWEYEGDGSNWNSCFMECAGQVQSPVNINAAVPDDNLSALEMTYTAVPVHLLNNGHTIQFEHEPGSMLKVGELSYELIQFHFHTQSEHTIDGIRYPMEVHLVHKNHDSGALAVVGIMFKQGETNAFLQNFIDNLPQDAEAHYMDQKMVNVADLLPEAIGYYTYDGSLTTPPCSEIVTWIVMKAPIEASPDQIDKLYNLMHNNYRPIQALNGREIREFE